jgi:tetratricopeptide (TPR) repeat protein
MNFHQYYSTAPTFAEASFMSILEDDVDNDVDDEENTTSNDNSIPFTFPHTFGSSNGMAAFANIGNNNNNNQPTLFVRRGSSAESIEGNGIINNNNNNDVIRKRKNIRDPGSETLKKKRLRVVENATRVFKSLSALKQSGTKSHLTNNNSTINSGGKKLSFGDEPTTSTSTTTTTTTPPYQLTDLEQRTQSLISSHSRSQQHFQETISQIQQLQSQLNQLLQYYSNSSSTTITTTSIKSLLESLTTFNNQINRAEELKLRGNSLYGVGKYQEADEAYAEACKWDTQSPINYANRAAALLMLGNYSEALTQCRRALSIDPTYLKAQIRQARALLSLGEATEALGILASISSSTTTICSKTMKEVYEMSQSSRLFLQLVQESETLILKEDLIHASKKIQSSLEIAPQSSRANVANITLKFAEMSISGNKEDSISTLIPSTFHLLEKFHPDDIVRGGSILLRLALRSEAQAFFEVAERITHGKHLAANSALKLVRELDVKLKEAARYQNEGRFQDAIRSFDATIGLDPTNDALIGRILYQRAGANIAQGHFQEAEEDCRKSLRKLPNYVKSYIRKAKTLLAMSKYIEAKLDLTFVQNHLAGKITSQQLQEINMLLMKCKECEKATNTKSTTSSSSSQYESFHQSSSSSGSSSGSFGREKENSYYYKTSSSSNNTNNNTTTTQQSKLYRNTTTLLNRPYYKILGVTMDANEVEIKKAYKKAALRLHPDKNPSTDAAEEFRKLHQAFLVLKSPTKRKLYDETGVVI